MPYLISLALCLPSCCSRFCGKIDRRHLAHACCDIPMATGDLLSVPMHLVAPPTKLKFSCPPPAFPEVETFEFRSQGGEELVPVSGVPKEWRDWIMRVAFSASHSFGWCVLFCVYCASSLRTVNRFLEPNLILTVFYKKLFWISVWYFCIVRFSF
jgi:hypothetical protein